VAERSGPSYLASTRHPVACFVFLLPLIAAYEFGVHWIGGANANGFRNGADVWFRWLLERYGFGQLWAAPLVVLGWFFLRSIWERKDRPKHLIGTTFGMLIESILFAGLLWAFSRNFRPIMDHFGIPLQIEFKSPAMGQLITYIGVGIYEEVLFRLCLFSVMVFILRIVLFPTVVAVPVAAVAAALAFSAAHHIGDRGEWPINASVFLFRTLAGLYFTILYITRGFGVAVGAHAGYDILVGVAVQPATITPS
jgi:hypothetical protein